MKIIKYTFFVSVTLVIISVVFSLSFHHSFLDNSVLVLLLVSGVIGLFSLMEKLWIKVLLGGVILMIVVFIYSYMGFLHVEKRIDRNWTYKNYEILLQHELEWAGPGRSTFIVNRHLLFGLIDKEIEKRPTGAIYPPQKFQFVLGGESFEIQCCAVPDYNALKNIDIETN